MMTAPEDVEAGKSLSLDGVESLVALGMRSWISIELNLEMSTIFEVTFAMELQIWQNHRRITPISSRLHHNKSQFN